MKLLRVDFPLQIKANNKTIYIYSRGHMLVQWSYITCTCVHTSVTVRSISDMPYRKLYFIGNKSYTILEVI